MAKAQNSLPPEETRYPGVSITARDGAHYRRASETSLPRRGFREARVPV